MALLRLWGHALPSQQPSHGFGTTAFAFPADERRDR